MNKHLFLSSLLLSLFFNIHAQSISWSFQYESTFSYASVIALDNDENIIITGRYSGSLDVDTSIDSTQYTSVGGQDIFIAKYDANHNLLWGGTIGGNSSDGINSIAFDSENNVYFTGVEQSTTVDFDISPNVENGTNGNSFILKYDENGNFKWVRNYWGNGGNKIVLDSGDNIFIVAGFSGTRDFDFGPGTRNYTATGNRDMIILQLDTAGNSIWEKQLNGNEDELLYDFEIDDSNILYLLFSITDSIDVDPSPNSIWHTSDGSENWCIAKFNNNGNYLWSAQYETSNIYAYDLTVDNNENIYLAGEYYDRVDIDFTNDSTFLDDPFLVQQGFIAKYSPSGSLIWSKNIGGESINYNWVEEIDFNGTEAIYILGAFEDSAIIDNTIIDNTAISNAYANFLSKIDLNGNVLWTNSFAANNENVYMNNMCSNSALVYATGYFEGDLFFNQDTSQSIHSSINDNGFVVQVSCTETMGSLSPVICNGESFLAPSGALFNTTGIYTDIIKNQYLCDSVLTIDLTVIDLSAISISQSDSTLTASASFANYQWFMNGQAITGATNETLMVSENGDYYCEVTENGCTENSNSIAVDLSTSIINLSSVKHLIVYPNPTYGKLVIETNEIEYTVVLFDYSGKEIIEVQNQNHIDLSNISKGIYTLVLTTNDNIYSTKIFVK